MPDRWRLGLDLGWNSLGWCALALDAKGDPVRTIDLGVRLFADGRDAQKGTSLAADRRMARQARRNRDRYLGRRERLMQALVAHGLMPADANARRALVGLNPYELRSRALSKPIAPHELGRALYHLHQRRGFRSLRKGAGEPDEEAGKIESAVERLRTEMDAVGAPTMGAYFANLLKGGRSVRARLQGKGAKAAYPFYPHRDLVAQEFAALWDAQQPHHPALLTSSARVAIEAVFFEQRPLKPVNPGTCLFEHPEPRAPMALPLFQRFRIWNEINNLRIEAPGAPARRLTGKESHALAGKLGRTKALTFKQLHKLIATTDPRATFSLERPGRDGLDGDKTGTALASKKLFGPAWWDKDEAAQDTFVEALLHAEDDAAVDALAAREGLADPVALRKLRLPDGYARLGRTALGRLLPHMRDGGLDYPSAAEAAGYHHSDFRKVGDAKELPPYQVVLDRHLTGGTGEPAETGDPLYDKKKGRFPNPTVHIGLNQLRRVVNALIEKHGPPTEIVVELARELKQSAKQREEEEKRNRQNREANDRRRGEIASVLSCSPEAVSGADIKKMRLWEELARDPLERRCVYTGEKIGVARLFGPDIAVDHILPFAETWDDTAANQIVCVRAANERKGKRTPFAAFGGDADWPEIEARADALPKNKHWRFKSDALERFSKEGGFVSRQLNDTKYLSRLAKDYLGAVCNPDKVWAIPGGLTAMLRGKWGLNSILSDDNRKNRTDHRHHAIDAFVVGCTDRGMLQRLSAAAARGTTERVIEDMPPPWPGFDRDVLREKVCGTFVSLRPDHGRGGRLHEETAYGRVEAEIDGKTFNLVHRKVFTDLTAPECARIRDPDLRRAVASHLATCGLPHADALAAFATAPPAPWKQLRHVRLLKQEDPNSLVPVINRSGAAYKTYIAGENYCIDIYRQPDNRWVGMALSRYAAADPVREAAAIKAARLRGGPIHPAAKKVMRLHKGDFVRLEADGQEKVMRVVRLSISNNIVYLAAHAEGGELAKRHNDRDDPFRWLFANISGMRERRARKVAIDPLGRVHDPGFRER
jgi:CRISPR-associated endonuclease Csn1